MSANGKSCKFHPDRPARWHCPDCSLYVCSYCVQANDRDEAFCPVCDLLLIKIDISVNIQPFWKRMPSAFIYPLYPASLTFLILISLASLLQLVPIGGIIAAFLLPFILMKYAFQVLQHTAVGHLQAPKGSTSMSGRDFELPLKNIFQIILFSLFASIFATLGLLGQIVDLVGVLTIFPVAVMVLGVTRSFFRSINPLEIFEMIRMIGASYFGLSGMLFLLVGADVALFQLIGPMIATSNILVVSVIATFINSYYIIVMFHLMGYVIYQFHEELGIRPEVEYQPQGIAGKPRQSIGISSIAKARLLVQEGHPEAAKRFIIKHLRCEMTAEQIQLNELYLKLLKQLGEDEEAGCSGRDFIIHLMEHGYGKKALQIFRFCHESVPDFQLNHADHTHTLVQAAQKASDYDLMLDIAANFANRYPGYPKLFELYLAVALVLHEHFKRDQQAAKILKSLIARFPQHEGIQHAKMALNRIIRVQQSA